MAHFGEMKFPDEMHHSLCYAYAFIQFEVKTPPVFAIKKQSLFYILFLFETKSHLINNFSYISHIFYYQTWIAPIEGIS